MRGDDVLSCRQAAGRFGISEVEARRLLRARVAAGDEWPLKLNGAWVAPVFWWHGVLTVRGKRARDK